MPNYITEENNDAALAAGMDNFIAEATANQDVLGLEPSDIQTITDAFSEFKADFADQTTARLAAKAATSTKNGSKRAAKQVIARYAQEWRANLAIPDSVLDKLNVPNHATGNTRTAPTQPLNLQITSNTSGENTLNWKRNGNNASTVFQIESAPSASGPWTTFEVLTSTRYKFDWPIGQEVWFRVIAKRNGLSSAPSQSIALWASGGSGELQVAA